MRSDQIPWLTVTTAFILALVLPVVLLVIRNTVRRARADIINEFEKIFGLATAQNASFEFAKSKYSGPDNFSWWKLYLAALPFMIIAFLGLSLAFLPLSQSALLKDGLTFHDLISPTLLTNGGHVHDAATDSANLETVTTIATIAFIGSFISALIYLIRAIANFDLAPLTFFRVTLNMLLSIATAIVLWRTIPNIYGSLFGASVESAVDVSLIWYGVAFLIGFYPDLGLTYLLQRIPLPLKRGRDDLIKQTAITSIELLDGIDIWKRFRLEEVDIMDVQNLATMNPIIMFVETPYGFYECFDWVAQAQLCTIVGSDRFCELRRRNVRTIFDLERAVLGPQATETGRRIVAEALWATGPQTVEFFAKWRRPADEPGESAPATRSLVSETYDDPTFQHLVRVMLNDLHIHRLRQLWIDIARKLGANSMSLSDLYAMETTANAPGRLGSREQPPEATSAPGPQPIQIPAHEGGNGRGQPRPGESPSLPLGGGS